MKGFSSCLQVSNNTGHYISTTHYNQYSELVEGLCKDFNPDYNKDNDDINYKKNIRDEKDDGVVGENDMKYKEDD